MNNIAIIGMGALGLLFGDMLQSAFDVGFIVDPQRRAAYVGQSITINGTVTLLSQISLLPQ